MWLFEDFSVQQQTAVSQWRGIINQPEVLELISLYLCMPPEIRLTQPSNILPFFWWIHPRPFLVTTPAAHSLDATDSAWFCEHAAAYNSARIKPDLETFEQPFFFITCFLLLLLPLLLLFPPLHHFHPRSAFVDSCPERECAVWVRVCAIFFYISTHFWQVFFFWGGGVSMFCCCHGLALPRADEVLLY